MSNSLGAAAGIPALSCAGSLAEYPGSSGSGRLLVGPTCGSGCRRGSDSKAIRAGDSAWRAHSPAASSGGSVLGIWALLLGRDGRRVGSPERLWSGPRSQRCTLTVYQGAGRVTVSWLTHILAARACRPSIL